MKRFVVLIMVLALTCTTCLTTVYGATGTRAATQNVNSSPAIMKDASGAAVVVVHKATMFYIRPDLAVELNGIRQVFKDAKGNIVHPLVYNGNAYLSLRAASAIMKEPIEWDTGSKTIFIGRTLAFPVKAEAIIPSDAAIAAEAADIEAMNASSAALVTGYSKNDISVMYDFVIQTFQDTNGLKLYPLNYNGSNYLPITAISKLSNLDIRWDGEDNKIYIGTGAEQVTRAGVDANTALLKDAFDREEALYYEASAKIAKVKKASKIERRAIAAAASDNYFKVQSMTMEVKGIDQSNFTSMDKNIYEKLSAFAESNEYYILILENIAHLAANDSDYSMFADTFLYFALDAQNKMEEFRAEFQ